MVLLIFSNLPLHAQAQDNAPAERNLQPSEEKTIAQIVQSLTRKEKTRLVVGGGWKSLFAGYHFPFTRGAKVPGAAGTTHALPQHGIPQIVLSDGPAGVRIRPTVRGSEEVHYATAFPGATLLACTWDTAAVARIGRAMGAEARDYGVDVLLAPGMNLMRNPLCGRNYEYYSEDPLLTGLTAAAMVRGIQSQGVGACVKHFAANNQETNRTHNNSVVEEQVLRDIYLRAFEIAIKQSQPWSVMASYNLVNGTHARHNRWLLTDVLRKEWRYEGVVMTDWGFFGNSPLRVAAGCDLMMPGDPTHWMKLSRALRRGKLSEETLDTAVTRVLQLIRKTHTYQSYSPSNAPDLKGHAQLTREIAAQGMVLLKNRSNTLPLSPCRIALYGANSYELIAGGVGSGYVDAPYRISLAEGLENANYTLQATIKADYEQYATRKSSRMKAGGFGFVQKYMGHGALKEMAVTAEYIHRNMTETDAAIICIGRQAGEGEDRELANDFQLTEDERMLIYNVCAEYHAVGKRVIVVLNVNGVIETESWKYLPDAILLAWCPGEEGGNSMADIISGKVNPSGALTMTWPIRYEDIPSAQNFPTECNDISRKETRYEEGYNVGYRYFQHHPEQVSYPFGFGLSYTSFEESEPIVSADGKEIRITVRNTGGVAGRHIVKYYDPEDFHHPLIGFGKTRLLAPEEQETVVIRSL